MMNILRHVILKIAQVPGRGEPDSDGEINFKHVLATLDSLNYQVTEQHPEALANWPIHEQFKLLQLCFP